MFCILIVDDCPGDVLLLKEAMRTLQLPAAACSVRDGVEALDFLQRRKPFTDAPRPDLILLDINMPRLSGHEVLFTIKSHPEFSYIPIVMLSSSTSPDDVRRSYQAYANCYVQKPVDWEGTERLVRGIRSFWLEVVTLPPKYQIHAH